MSEQKAPEYYARNAEEYLSKRLNFKFNHYRKKGDLYRQLYLTMTSISTISAAAVPVLINVSNVPSFYPTLLSLLVTVLVGLEGVFHFRESWKNYDLMKIYLLQESCMFQAKAGAYMDKTEATAFLLLVERVEDAISKERSQTLKLRTSHLQSATTQKNHPNDP